MAKKHLDYYLNLPYTYIIEWSDVDSCFLGSIVELERNMTCELLAINLKTVCRLFGLSLKGSTD